MRRWVAATVTRETPAITASPPPGTATPKRNEPAVPTHRSPSQAASERSATVMSRISSRLSGDWGTPPKARFSPSYQPSHSDARRTRSSMVMRHVQQGARPGRDPISAARPVHRG